MDTVKMTEDEISKMKDVIRSVVNPRFGIAIKGDTTEYQITGDQKHKLQKLILDDSRDYDAIDKFGQQ